MRYLTAVPVFNEVNHVDAVLESIVRESAEVLVIDDGSTDGTSERLRAWSEVHVVRHGQNRGYGAALRSAFRYAINARYDWLITLDCDGQHKPELIRSFIESASGCDVVSGSRYLGEFAEDTGAPDERRQINQLITAELNEVLGLRLTDAFCGYKAYRVGALSKLELTRDGYAMPLEFWVQAAAAGLRIRELPVPRIYLDGQRTFGGALDDPHVRIRHYRQVLADALARIPAMSEPWGCDELAWCAKSMSPFC